jgi:UDP-glucose 4-epimerase
MKQYVIITGGAGYIGSHTILELLEQDKYQVICVDNYANSSPESLTAVSLLTKKEIIKIEADLCDYSALTTSLKPYLEQVIGIVHFAALKAVGDSVQEPIDYYQNNLNAMLNMLKVCEQFNIKHFIFSSSCSVYGNITASQLPVNEATEKSSTESPYAETKKMGERILEDVAKAKNIKGLALRYFNPVGAHKSTIIGENPKSKPNNLVPVICKSALGISPKMSVFGLDYDTRDGSCIRDYIHVVDIAKAHVKALNYITNQQKEPFDVINLGSGDGTTVIEAISAFEKVTHQKLDYHIAPRRAGDVVAVYSDTTKAKQLLDWETQCTVEEMMQSAWNWEIKLNKEKP